MAKKYAKNICDYILKGNYTEVNKHDDFDVKIDLCKTPDKGDIVLAVNKSEKEINPERTAIIMGLILTAGVTFVEIKSIINLIENHQGNLPTNGIILGGVLFAILCGFVIKRTFELIGLSRFKFLATEYLEKEQPQYALDLYKHDKILLK